MIFEPTGGPIPPLYARSAFATALKARPGHWALLGTHETAGSARQFALAIRKASSGAQAFAPAGAYEAEMHTMLGGEHRIYVRYVGSDAA